MGRPLFGGAQRRWFTVKKVTSPAKVAPCCYSNDLANSGTLLQYGATIRVPFGQRTGLPASSKSYDPETLRPSNLLTGNAGEVACTPAAGMGESWQPTP